MGSTVDSAGCTRAAGATDGSARSTGAANGSARSTGAGRVGGDADLDSAAIGLAVDAAAASPSVPRVC